MSGSRIDLAAIVAGIVSSGMTRGDLFAHRDPHHVENALGCIDRTLEQSQDSNKLSAWRESAAEQVAGLTCREREIMDLVSAGHPSKNIAVDLGISQRTVENHRASVMKKTGVKSLPALARLALTAASHGNDGSHIRGIGDEAT